MKTYPARTATNDRLVAFEVENAYIGFTAVAWLLQQASGVSDVKRRKLFAADSDIHLRFLHRGHPCIVWEPYGDSSRYWVGPENPEAFSEDLREVEQVFDGYRPQMWRTVIGKLMLLSVLK